MEIITLILFLLAMAGVYLLAAHADKDSKRARLVRERFGEKEREILRREVPIYEKIPEQQRGILEGMIHIFLDEKHFEACGDLEEVTEEMRLVIAANACLLQLNRKPDYYEKLRSILVYPEAYVATMSDGAEHLRLGESWSSGSVVLSWASVKSGSRNAEDGHNVALHEFAHQLDQANGTTDGLPKLSEGHSYREWARTFQAAFAKFSAKVNKGKKTVIDEYGATNAPEFFAVATETFFEKPKQLKKSYPEVYEQLQKFYKLDPVNWN